MHLIIHKVKEAIWVGFTMCYCTQLSKMCKLISFLVPAVTSALIHCVMTRCPLMQALKAAGNSLVLQLIPILISQKAYAELWVSSQSTQQCISHLRCLRSQAKNFSCYQINIWFPMRSWTHPFKMYSSGPPCGELWPMRFPWLRFKSVHIDQNTVENKSCKHPCSSEITHC